ncbi:hypothetical protein SAMN05421788_111190 [Filimonas lacunae]|uniref:Tetratricopeptide repeat-containing protein n=1 Tax=Filimonas lacunae TaxID=477680 RepID=A0A1N7RC80_9BACT|nr:tetratricopeptide repeat protein [Filimonas lacunae]SIT32652.1 hypothetical protein SAMN05421788_111190 [Filimonas lacunae]
MIYIKGSQLQCRMNKSFTAFALLLCAMLLFSVHPLLAQGNAAARYEIDAKRQGVKPTDKDALPRSREFIRLDSTYYVGWMYEGIYKCDRSSDYLGYKNAIPALQKALALIEKDYGNSLRGLYSSIEYFAQNVPRYQDMFFIFNALKECYDNLEMPDKVIELLDKIDRYHFKKDYFGTYYHRAWTYHRNRFLTSANFPFLKNSVEENERMAFFYCYQGLRFIQQNKPQNDTWFGPMQAENDKLTIYHYMAMLHCYNKNYDSSEYYYRILASRGAVSWNNYGSMQAETGNFARAIEYYKRDQFKSFSHILHEPYYYLPMLSVYGGKTKEAIKTVQEIIQQNGSTPGFGWYNLALARSYMYDGQLDSSEYALNKAANFKEIHIGTTLTQSQYNFTVNLLRVQLLDRKISQVKFTDKGWWYSPTALYKIASYTSEKMKTEYVTVNELAFNPERTRVVYDLFCSEATTSFDEAWYLMKDFSPTFFQKKYENYLNTDKRENVLRYFYLFAAKFKWEKGDKNEARTDFETLEKNSMLDTANEKLFMGRLYEGLIKAGNKTGQSYVATYTNALYETYPQLLPFSGITPSISLSVSGQDDAVTKAVVKQIKGCDISVADENTPGIPHATIQFNKRGNKYEALFQVISGNGKPMVQGGRLIFTPTQQAGAEITLRLFGKGGAVEL